jgi:hypothetical protein
MKLISKALVFIALAGLIGIQFAAVIDDPQHLAEPDPDCPICLAANTQICIPPHVSISYTPDIIFYLIEKASFDQQKEAYLSILSIRAPPIS